MRDVLGLGAVLNDRGAGRLSTAGDDDRDGEQERRMGGVAPPVLLLPHYQPEAAQISFFSRAASAPAAWR